MTVGRDVVEEVVAPLFGDDEPIGAFAEEAIRCQQLAENHLRRGEGLDALTYRRLADIWAAVAMLRDSGRTATALSALEDAREAFLDRC